MSVAPKNRTRILVKDLEFQAKHQLTHTEVDIMAYIINALSWSLKVGECLVIVNKKFLDDLPQIGIKTLENTLKELEAKGLIERESVRVPKWRNATVRGIIITIAGLKYNNHYYNTDEQKIIKNLEEQLISVNKKLQDLKISYEKVEVKAVEKEEIKNEEKPQVAEPLEDKIVQNDESNTQDKPLKIENKQEKSISNSSNLNPITPQKEELKSPVIANKIAQKYAEIDDLSDFKNEIKRDFQDLGAPICNGVDGWYNATIFSINSYGKIHIKTSETSYQLNDPEEVYKFWEWLFTHKERIGDIKDFTPVGEKLTNIYKNTPITINNIHGLVDKIEDVEGGVVLYCFDVLEERIFKISLKNDEVMTVQRCEEIIKDTRCDL